MMIEMIEIKKIEFKIWKMSCVDCENRIKKAILDVDGVKNITVSYFTEKASIEFDPTRTDIRDIMKTITNIGYEPKEIN